MSDSRDTSQNPFDSEQVDPEIADLLGINQSTRPSSDKPSFESLMSPSAPEPPKPIGRPNSQTPPPAGSGDDFSDITRTAFPEVKHIQTNPRPIFADKNFYKIILSGEGEIGTKIHQLLGKLIKTEDPEERSNSRLRLIPAFWDLVSNFTARLGSLRQEPKKLMMRYGILLPSLISADQRKILSSIIPENNTGEPIHYQDEWLGLIAREMVNPLATDEVKVIRKNEKTKVNQKLERVKGQQQAQLGLIQNKQQDIARLESEMATLTDSLKVKTKHIRYQSLHSNFTEVQRSNLSTINEISKKLLTMDREIQSLFKELDNYTSQLGELSDRAMDFSDAGGNSEKALAEVNTLKQLAKLTAGRQGNKLPILMKQYMPHRIQEVATRENVLKMMSEIERLDPGLFLRSFKGTTNRIVPHIILLPSYGDQGYCWEPFEKFNKSSSRGRVGIPMYPKNLRMAVLWGMADLRWQVAKEKAAHYWMEEGITGFYYQWFLSQKMKGDVRLQFIQDYILWITKESEGTQKLHKEVRGIFWRNIPFPEDLRNSLKNRGFVYSELHKKDYNRSISDGY